jgi:hypothetical protein
MVVRSGSSKLDDTIKAPKVFASKRILPGANGDLRGSHLKEITGRVLESHANGETTQEGKKETDW